MDTIKTLLLAAFEKFARPFLSKVLTRYILIGLAFLCGWLGMDPAAHGGWVSGFVAFVLAALAASLQLLIDYIHHRKDLAQVPPEK